MIIVSIFRVVKNSSKNMRQIKHQELVYGSINAKLYAIFSNTTYYPIYYNIKSIWKKNGKRIFFRIPQKSQILSCQKHRKIPKICKSQATRNFLIMKPLQEKVKHEHSEESLSRNIKIHKSHINRHKSHKQKTPSLSSKGHHQRLFSYIFVLPR